MPVRNVGDRDAHQQTHKGSTRKIGARERRRKNTQVMVKKSPNLMKYINLHVQETQLMTSMLNANLHPDTLW